ncbi:hypothetical protein, partial [Rosenbergiella nectarea]|uniref:hypothetical protein n=1 Tax=Rosenbergiella nectarea TaxID=988801 RepID=UPI001F4E95E4
MKSSGSALAFKDRDTLLAFVPSSANVLAMDTSTGDFYFWDGAAWSLTASQTNQEINALKE